MARNDKGALSPRWGRVESTGSHASPEGSVENPFLPPLTSVPWLTAALFWSLFPLSHSCCCCWHGHVCVCGMLQSAPFSFKGTVELGPTLIQYGLIFT